MLATLRARTSDFTRGRTFSFTSRFVKKKVRPLVKGHSPVGPLKRGARFSRCAARPSAASGPPRP